MSTFKAINVRPPESRDLHQLEAWRRQYFAGDLELPKGWFGKGVETAVAEKDGLLLGSLTATRAIVLDPLISNPVANGLDMVSGILLLERALTYVAQCGGAIDSYIAVPSQLTEYHKIVENAGYVRTVEFCHVFRRPLLPDTHPLLGPERDAILKKMNADASTAPEPSTV